MRSWNRASQMGNLRSRPATMSLRPSRSPKQDAIPTQKAHRPRFYDDYRKVADEYDKEFLKKHDEDLNTTLIFVSFPLGFYRFVLIEDKGWFILCSHLRLHHSVRLPAPTKFQRRDRRASSCSHLQNRQHHLRKRPSHSPTMGRSSPLYSPSSSHPLHESRHLIAFRIPCNARQTMVEPL